MLSVIMLSVVIPSVVAPRGLILKYLTRSVRYENDKHAGLFWNGVNYRQKSFVELIPDGKMQFFATFVEEKGTKLEVKDR